MTRSSRESLVRASRTALLVLAAFVILTACGIAALVRLPGVPYNVSSLLLAGPAARLAFALSLVWLGAGPMLLARWLGTRRRLVLSLPFGLSVVSLVSLVLLS